MNSEVECSISPLVSSGDIEVVHNNSEHLDKLMKDYDNQSAEISDYHIDVGNHNKSNLSIIEQMDFQMLSEQLGIAITDHGESPSLDVQRTLQLRAEEHARYLQKIIEDRHNAGNSLVSSDQIQTMKSQPEYSDQSSPPKHESKARNTSSRSNSATEFKYEENSKWEVEFELEI